MKYMIMLAWVAVAPTASAQNPDSEQGIALTFLSHRSGYNQVYTSESDGSNPQPFFGGPITDSPSFDDSYTMFREPLCRAGGTVLHAPPVVRVEQLDGRQ